MSKKKHDADPLDIDDPGHPDFPHLEGDDIGVHPKNELLPGTHLDEAPPPIPVVETSHELMAGWYRAAKDTTPDPAAVGDHFDAYASARGWQLTKIDPPVAGKAHAKDE